MPAADDLGVPAVWDLAVKNCCHPHLPQTLNTRIHPLHRLAAALGEQDEPGMARFVFLVLVRVSQEEDMPDSSGPNLPTGPYIVPDLARLCFFQSNPFLLIKSC